MNTYLLIRTIAAQQAFAADGGWRKNEPPRLKRSG